MGYWKKKRPKARNKETCALHWLNSQLSFERQLELKNASWHWQWAHPVICTCNVHFLSQDPVKSHKETHILANYVDGSNSIWYCVAKFHVATCNTFQDMNFILVWISFTDRQTDRKWRLWAHCATCTGGLKNLRKCHWHHLKLIYIEHFLWLAQNLVITTDINVNCNNIWIIKVGSFLNKLQVKKDQP